MSLNFIHHVIDIVVTGLVKYTVINIQISILTSLYSIVDSFYFSHKLSLFAYAIYSLIHGVAVNMCIANQMI
jgi:hypothetical protein